MKFYVTTSIAYVNDSPHIGFAMELIMADVLARHARERGDDTMFSTGTDEHGGKIAEKAKKQGIEPRRLADEVSSEFVELTKLLNISNDKFIRTTDNKHEEISQQIWLALRDDIYKSKYEGWYCTGDEAFFTETTVRENKGICPAHNRPYEKIEEENYFFRTSRFSKEIKDAIVSDKLKVIPESRKNEILQVIEDGLEDISISRPKEKIEWGISVPNDDSQVMYVWFEALLNYITVLDYPEGTDFKKFWPADYQMIGKDIIRFHVAIWPAILLSLGLPLPKTIYSHGFVTVDDVKMSKSLGNVIKPKEVVEKYGVDAFRYYILRHIPSYSDGDFSWKKFHQSYQNELGNELGNALQRTVVMVVNYLDGKFDLNELQSNEEVSRAIDLCHFDRALDEIWTKIRSLNQYIDENKPWSLHKNNEIQKLKEVLNTQVSRLRNIASELKPFLPDTANKMESVFNTGKVVPLNDTLFPRIEQ